MSEPEAVAVVIPSWNSLELLPRCLASLARQDVSIELLVVDNGSVDGSLVYLEREGIPHISLPTNVGFAAAVNLGVQRTSASSILVLNVDTALEPGCVGKLLEALGSDATLGGVQPRILQMEKEAGPPAGTPRIYSAGQALTKDGRALEMGAGEPQQSEHLHTREVFGVCGAAALLKKEMFAELGGYDERYFAFYEDVDLNVRARISGWRFAYVPEAVIWHVGNASWQEGFDNPTAENARLVARNRLATQIKFMPPSAAPWIAVVEVGALMRALRRHRFWATLRGKLSALRWLPGLVADRRRLRRKGNLTLARRWLGETDGAR